MNRWQKNRTGKTLRVNFTRLPLLAAMAALVGVAAALWLAPAGPPVAQAQASCGSGPLNGRTQAVVDAILAKLSETDCSAVTNTQLAGITGDIDLSRQTSLTLQNGDFAGLTSLTEIDLADSNLRADALPEDLFDGLTSLERLLLSNNSLRGVMHEDLFDGLTNLQILTLYSSALGEQPLHEDLFDGLTNLRILRISSSIIADVPEDLFDGLTSLRELDMYSTNIAVLPPDIFDGLTNLENALLFDNNLTWLPPDLFDGLTNLRDVDLQRNTDLACVHAGQFDGLSQLRDLDLSSTKLGNLSPDHFDRWSLDSLDTLNLGDDLIADTTIDFQQYKNVLPALVEANTSVRGSDGLSDPICASIEAETDGSGFHTSVTVRLPHTSVYPNRVRVSDAAMLGDGLCGSDATATRHELWTWQRSADGLTWADMDVARQPPDYGTRTSGQCSYTYTPQSDDNTMYVRAYVMVTTTGLGNNNYHSAVFGPLNVQ